MKSKNLILAGYFYEYVDENNFYFIKWVKLSKGTTELYGRVKITNVINDKDYRDDSIVELVSYSYLESILAELSTKDNNTSLGGIVKY
jgi:hypothetical protein